MHLRPADERTSELNANYGSRDKGQGLDSGEAAGLPWQVLHAFGLKLDMPMRNSHLKTLLRISLST